MNILKNKHILFYQWNAYNLSDTRWALEQKGFTVTMLTEPIANPEEDTEYVHELTQRLSVEACDFVFSLNYFPVLAESCHQTDIPYVCWNCDGSLLAMYHTSIFYPTNVIFTFDYKNFREFQELGVKNIYHLPLAVNTHRLERQLSSIPSRGNESPGEVGHRYPVSFVGSLYEHSAFRDIEDSLPDYLAGYLRGTIHAQKLVSGGNMLELLLTEDIVAALEELSSYHKSDQSFAGVKQLFATTILGFQVAHEERTENLNALAEHLAGLPRKQDDSEGEKPRETMGQSPAVHLFTGSQGIKLPLVALHPPVDYFREMPAIFRQSDINLNMTIPNITTGIPLRVWDILGCGGFLLSNYQPEFDNYFDLGTHLDIFEEPGELLEKTEFYLRHETLRQKIAEKGQALVAREHNYLTRIEQLLKILNELSIL